MNNTPSVFLAVSGVVLVAWYASRRWQGGQKPTLPVAEPGSPEYRMAAEAAMMAEFHAPPPPPSTAFPGGSVYCPDCHSVFPAGVLYCECGAETAEYDEGGSGQNSDDAVEVLVEGDEKLVCVYIATNQWKASLLKSMLESHDIPCATGGNSSSGPYSFTVGYMGEVRLFVPASREEEAKRLIQACA